MDAGALGLQRRALGAWMDVMAHSSPEAALYRAEGVIAALVPACPERSIVNCVTYRDAGALADALAGLAAAYSEAGVRAWTVWVPEGDAEAPALLEAAGHRLDGEPAAMHLELERLEGPRTTGLDWDDRASAEEVGLLNDLAYGYEPGGGPSAAIGPGPERLPTRLYRARESGEVACVMQAIDVDDDCFITFVATLERFRGRRLASRLLGAALAQARERGLRTSTLQSSMLGRGVYERLGYEVDFRLRLYERRG